MKLGAKVMWMMGAATAGMALALYAVSHLVVRTGYLNLEQRHARTNVDRALRAVKERMTQLGITAADWSLWDDSYRFVQDRNPVFIKENLIPAGYVTLKLHSLLIVDTSNTIVWGQAVDSPGTGFTPLPPELLRFAEAGSARVLPGSQQNLIAGIVMLEAGPMVLAAHRMLPTTREGPARGTLIMGRMLDSAAIEELSAALQLKVSAFRVDALPAGDLPDGVLAALSDGTPGEIRVLDRTAIAGYGLVRDLYGNPALVIEVRMLRDIFAQGLRTASILGYFVLLVTLGFSGAVVIMLRRQVTSRLARLSRDISCISDAGDFSRRVALTGSDELSAVADNVNRLLAGVVESRRALLKSEERIRHIVESTMDWIWEIDPSGLYTYASPVVERILGYRPDEIVGKKHFYDLFAPAGREPLTRAALDMISRKESFLALVNANVHKDGHEVVLETRGVPVLGEQGALEGYRGANRDVTERQRTEAALASAATETRRLLAEAEKSRRALLSVVEDQKRAETERKRLETQNRQNAKMEAVGRLAGGVAHDFNNKLQVILGSAQILLEMVPPNDVTRPLLEEIQTAGQRSADLTRQLLAFSREQAVAPVVLDLNMAVSGSLKMLGRLIGENIRLDFLATTGLWPVTLDPGQLDQILANLTVNARDAISGTGTFTIRASNRTLHEADCRNQTDFVPPGDYLVLTFCDDGAGMAPEVRAHIFEPFFTTKAVGKGTGLGLATVYGIVKQNHGAIEVDSEPGRGTTFTIHLPRSNSATRAAVEDSLVQTPGGTETILLVEDEPSVLNLLRVSLAQQGYKVLSAESPHLALEVCERHSEPIHLLLTDVMMPGMSGKALAERIRTLRPGIRVLFMSGYTAEIMKKNGAAPKDLHLLQKPFSNADMAQHVREALDRATPANS